MLSASHNSIASLQNSFISGQPLFHMHLANNCLSSLQGLEHCRHLSKLHAHRNVITSLQPLKGLVLLRVRT